ncbi:hypothetical protein KI387_034682, partial [Taxus chinensis]
DKDAPTVQLSISNGVLAAKATQEVFNEISSREMERINVFHDILRNWVFIAVLSSTVIFREMIIEFMGSFANTTPLNCNRWLCSVLIGVFSMPVAMLVQKLPVSLNQQVESKLKSE